jgi:protein phosphatase 2C family protein 2/3
MEYGQAQQIIEEHSDSKITKKIGLAKRKLCEFTMGRLKVTAAAGSWWGNKDFQEDRYVIDMEVKSPEGRKVFGFAVLDGHSGSMCVEHVMKNIGPNIQECLSKKSKLSEETLTQAVKEACALTDEEFLREAREVETLDGSTMVLVLMYCLQGSYRLLCANIGDSRAVLCTSRNLQDNCGSLIAHPLSTDHKPNRDDETERIEALGGVVGFEGVWRVFTPGQSKFGGQTLTRWGLAVSRSFGDLLMKETENYECAGVEPGGLVSAEPDFQSMELNPQEDCFIVLACDGIWDVLSSQDAVSVCADHLPMSTPKAVETLLRRTYASNSDDNITAVVVSWTEADD